MTAYVNYSLEGYRLDAVRYLLKSNANFQSTVNECMNAIMEKLNYSVAKREFDFNAHLVFRHILPKPLILSAFVVRKSDMKIFMTILLC